MSEPASTFYDRLAQSYHLTYADWRKEVIRQGAVLDRLLRSIIGAGPLRVLDCACGIGTQAIGLAARGHDVRATDVSPASVERARDESKGFGVEIPFDVADMRSLSPVVPGPFDVVVACDNVLPHLVTDDDLGQAARSARAVLRPGGVFVASLADYDQALRLRRRATPPQVFDGPDGTRVVQTLVDWAPDGRTYDFTLFILQREGDAWRLEHHTTVERALLRSECSDLLEAAGFGHITWHMPAETGFFQPLVTARRPEA
jgi:SAM-dependent methyltransferase